MTKIKKLFFAIISITSFSSFSSWAMETTENKEIELNDENYLEIKKEWSEDENYLKITINGVAWVFGPFNDPNENDKNPKNSNTIAQEKAV